MSLLKCFTLCLAFALIYVRPSNAAIKPATQINVKDTFYAYLDKPGKVQSCWFTFQNSELRIYLNSTTPITWINGLTILPFSETTCGVRGKITGNFNNPQVKLRAVFENRESDSGSMYIRITQQQRTVTNITSDAGKVRIKCAESKTVSTICTIMADNGSTWNVCDIEVTIDSDRTFDCYTRTGVSTHRHEHIIVKLRDPTIVPTSSMANTSHSIKLSCNFYMEAVNICQVELPNQTTRIRIQDDVTLPFYDKYYATLAKGNCVIEIPKPLNASEVGVWRIGNYDMSEGCLFYVGGMKNEIIERELKLVESKNINLYPNEVELPKIEFTLPFEVEECYILRPKPNLNERVEFPEQRKYNKPNSLGKCTFIGLSTINGTWTFGAIAKDNDAIVLRDVHVNIQSRFEKDPPLTVKADIGQPVEVMCRQSFEIPLKHCAFVDPQDRVYVLDDSYSSDLYDNVQYIGNGLEFGDCGIQINAIKSEDLGTWQCQYLERGNHNVRSFGFLLTAL